MHVHMFTEMKKKKKGRRLDLSRSEFCWIIRDLKHYLPCRLTHTRTALAGGGTRRTATFRGRRITSRRSPS